MSEDHVRASHIRRKPPPTGQLSTEEMQMLNALGIELRPLNPRSQCTSRDDPRPHLRSSITPEEGRILAEWASERRVLEIGTGLGVSTAYLASTAILVHTVDPDEWVLRALKFPSNVKQFSSLEGLPKNAVYDLAFIDGNHEYPAVFDDIAGVLQRMRRGFVGFHDCHMAGVKRAISEHSWSSHQKYTTIGHLSFYGI